MKKLLNIFFASILLLGLNSICMAQDTTTTKAGKNTACPNFVDKNNDGICDNFAAGKQGYQGRNFVDKNKDGICDNREVRGKNTTGRNFVDKNNDGICDNTGKGNRQNGKCCGKGNQHRYRNGRR